MEKFQKYDLVVMCLYKTLSEQAQKDNGVYIDGLELEHKTDKCILEVANMVQIIEHPEKPIYLSMGLFTYWKNKLTRRFRKFSVERTKRFLTTSNTRGGIIYKTCMKYCDAALDKKWKEPGKNFMIYSQIEDLLEEIYDEYYSPKVKK